MPAQNLLVLSPDYQPFIHTGAHNDGSGAAIAYRHDKTYGLWAVLDGILCLHDGKREQRLPGPTACFLCPEQGIQVTPTRGSVWYFLRFDILLQDRRPVFAKDSPAWCHNSVPRLVPATDIWGKNPPCILPEQWCETAIQTLRRCCAIWWHNELHHAQANSILAAWIMDVMTSTGKAGEADTSSKDEPILIRRSRRWANERLYQGITTADLAAANHMSLATFKRRFTACAGISPGLFIRQLRIDEACRRLQVPGQHIHDIAELCGYRSVAAFVRAFQRATGSNPSQWRQTQSLESTA